MSSEIHHIEVTSPIANTLCGKYELGKLLGRGAFAKVYRAKNITTGESVAVKVIKKKNITCITLKANIKREISIMNRLRHPHIVKLHEVLATKGKIYFIMEYVKGGELYGKFTKARFSENLSRKYFQQLIAAVGYCHSCGVYHRDLKPENLLIDEKGDLKVTDFGLSAVTTQIRQDGLLHTLCGTPAFVAPEILSKKGYHGSQVDVWSCGIILFVLTAGSLPFNDPNVFTMYKKIYKGDFRFPKWMSDDLKHLLSCLLDTNPMTRITIDEIIRDPWFKKGGCKEIKFYDEEIKHEEYEVKLNFNAFHILSFSSGLDLSGLFDDSYGERLVVERSPEKIMEIVETMAKEANIGLRKNKQWGVDLEGKNGCWSIRVVVHRLTDTLVVVEVKNRGGEATVYKELWDKKIKVGLLGQDDTQLTGK